MELKSCTFTLDGECYQLLRTKAHERKISMSALIRTLILKCCSQGGDGKL